MMSTNNRSCYHCGSISTYINNRNEPVWYINRSPNGKYLSALCGSCNNKLFPNRKFSSREQLSKFRSEYSKKHVSKEFLRQMGMKAHLKQAHRMSNIEKIMANALEDIGFNYIPQFRYELGYMDFLIKPNIAVFCDGEYWHNYPNYTDKDIRQTKFLIDKGYRVFRLWEREIENDIQGCINKLHRLMIMSSQ